jgi:PKD repeat protein
MGELIGSGISAPSERKGFSLSGYCQESSPDCWIAWRQNADNWYAKWSQETTSISLPTPSTISSYISDPAYHLFYELAHGASTYFQADSPGSNYYASDVEDAMNDREKMTFTFIGSCEGMTDTGPGTFSHEFRKGSFEDTVTIGYSGMGSCPGWSVSLEWQDYMFYVMNNGFPIKEAFDLACLEYPTIADCVVFVGDQEMKILEDEEDDDDDIGIPPNIFVSYPSNNRYVAGIVNIKGSADDLDGVIDHIFLQIDEGDWIEVDGANNWEYAWDTTTVEDGDHLITVVAVDDTGLSSGCKYVHVNVWNRAYKISIDCPTEAYVGESIQMQPIITGGNYYPYWLEWEFGDGTKSDEFEPTYTYQNAGDYQVSLTLTDALNRTVTASKTITVIEPDKQPPTIELIKPTKGIYINNQKMIDFPIILLFGKTDFTLDVTDEESEIQTIQINLNGDLKMNTTQSPCTWTWDDPCFGYNFFEVTAFDTMNNQQTIKRMVWKFF